MSIRLSEEDERNKEGKKEKNLQIFRAIVYLFTFGYFFYILINHFYLGFQGFGVLVHIPLIIAVYFIMWDFVIYNFREIANIITPFGFISLLFFSGYESCNRHHFMNILETTTSSITSQDNIDTYTENWILSRYQKGVYNLKDTQSIPLFIICGEGGGSKSGTWISAVLSKADSLTQGQFYNKTYAITTISGSSFGAFSILAHKKAFPDKNISEQYLQDIFQRDYLQHSITDIMTYDFLFGLTPLSKFAQKYGDRNVHLQTEEAYFTTWSLEKVRTNGDVKRPKISSYGFRQTSPYFKSISDFYYNEQHQLDRNHLPPLFIPATCRINDGKRAVAMPFKHDSLFFIDALEMVTLLEKDRKTLPLMTAINNSELFPAISASSFQPNMGNFIDGGSFENKGLSTGADIYRYVVTYQQKYKAHPNDTIQHFVKHVVPKVISIGIYPSNAANNSAYGEYVSQWFSTPQVALKTPFSGHTDYAYYRFERELKDNFIPIILDEDDKKDGVVMSRWISNKDFIKLHAKADTAVKVNIGLLK